MLLTGREQDLVLYDPHHKATGARYMAHNDRHVSDFLRGSLEKKTNMRPLTLV